MRVLLTTLPGSGHWPVLLPFARALVSAGHEVRVAAAASYGERIRRDGFEFAAVGMDWMEDRADDALPGFTGMRPPEHFATFARLGEGMAVDLVALAEQWRPDLVLHDDTELGAWLAAERLDVPRVAVGVGGALMPMPLRAFGGEAFAALCARHHLPVDPEYPTRWGALSPLPRSIIPFAGPADPLRPHVRPEHVLTPSPAARVATGGRPAVYVTAGTVYNQRLRPLLRCALALGPELDVVITTGPGLVPADLGEAPSHVRVASFVPQAELLTRLDVVVCHAGRGSLLGALGHGIPLVLAPVGADQPGLAAGCTARGVALNLGEPRSGEPFPVVEPDALRPERLRAAVATVLGEPSYRTAAAEVAAELAALPRIEEVVDWLVGVAADRLTIAEVRRRRAPR